MLAKTPPQPLNIPLVDLEPHHCREVVSPDGVTAAFCGHDKRPGSSYCWHHSGLNEYLGPPRQFIRPRVRAA